MQTVPQHVLKVRLENCYENQTVPAVPRAPGALVCILNVGLFCPGFPPPEDEAEVGNPRVQWESAMESAH